MTTSWRTPGPLGNDGRPRSQGFVFEAVTGVFGRGLHDRDHPESLSVFTAFPGGLTGEHGDPYQCLALGEGEVPGAHHGDLHGLCAVNAVDVV